MYNYKKINAYEKENSDNIFKYAEEYKYYLDRSKTERDAVKLSIEMAEKEGYKPYSFGNKLEVYGKYYYNNRNKNLFLFSIGDEDISSNGIRIMASHIDSPRIDLKQSPLYESENLAFMKTHYYGGIKKYQWTCVPLALHGIISTIDGETINVNIGEDDNDPIFYISDLLPHLSSKQNEKNLATAIEGESLNIWIGGIPLKENDEKAKKVKNNVLKIFHDKYGIIEEDFLCAELTCVPAIKARDVGIDRAEIAGYGHDDKVCSYPALTAQLSAPKKHTIITILADKEEIGSEGVTGMQCKLLSDLIEEISISFNANPRLVRSMSKCLSADVTSAYDPNFSDVFEKNNAAKLSHGVALMKFTGARGKSGSSDASGEFVNEIRKIFKEGNVIWQTSELGKVDIGGGGTVAKYIANLNIDTVDIGTPVISMHAPYELISKADLYETYKAFVAFCK